MATSSKASSSASPSATVRRIANAASRQFFRSQFGHLCRTSANKLRLLTRIRPTVVRFILFFEKSVVSLPSKNLQKSLRVKPSLWQLVLLQLFWPLASRSFPSLSPPLSRRGNLPEKKDIAACHRWAHKPHAEYNTSITDVSSSSPDGLMSILGSSTNVQSQAGELSRGPVAMESKDGKPR